MCAQTRVIAGYDNPEFIPLGRVERQDLQGMGFVEINMVIESAAVEAGQLQSPEVGFWRGIQAAARLVAGNQGKTDFSDAQLPCRQAAVRVVRDDDAVAI